MSASESQNAKGSQSRRRIRSAAHVVDILKCISKSQRPIGVNEIARLTSLDKSSISRMVGTLEEERMVERIQETAKFRLGLGVIALAAPLLTSLKLTSLVKPRLEQLSRELGETVNLSIWDGNESVSIAQVLGSNAITHYAAPGRRNPAHCTASGKVQLANCSDVEIETVLSHQLEVYTDATITNLEELRSELDEIRKSGFAINNGEFAADVAAAAVIVLGAGNQVIGALTVTAPMYRFNSLQQTNAVAILKAAATQLSEDIRCSDEI